MATTTLPSSIPAASAAGRADGAGGGMDLLGHIREARRTADTAEVQILIGAVDWAVANPPLFGREAAAWDGRTRDGSAPEELELTAEGVPDVDRAAVGELGIALGVSTQAAQRLLGDAMELAFRLPTLWTRLVAGEVKPWRARRIAQATRPLSTLAAAFVDREIAPAADRVNGHQLDGLIATAMARHDTELADQIAAERAEQRDVQIRLDETNLAGLTELRGWMDLPDALDLEAAVSHSAQQLAAWGSADPLNVRRARALGELAREHLSFQGQPVTGASDDEDGEPSDQDSCGATAGAAAGTRVPSKRQVILYAHLTDAAIFDMINRGTAGERAPVWMGRVENTSTPITAETIREWCSDPSTRVTVRPVLDLNGYQHADSYEVPSRIKEQIRLRDGTCVFPNCHARAIYCQDDHVEPFDHDNPEEGGRTESTNLRLLCQRHHNLKTHHGFRYLILSNGAVLWRTPHGLRIRRNRDGTVDYLTRHLSHHGPDAADRDIGTDRDADVVTARAAARAQRRRGVPGWDAIDGFESLNHANPAERPGAFSDLGPPPF